MKNWGNSWADAEVLSQVSGLKRETVYARLRRGWSREEALTPESKSGLTIGTAVLRGQRFGRWEVVKPNFALDDDRRHLVRCESGHEARYRISSLRHNPPCQRCLGKILSAGDVIGEWTLLSLVQNQEPTRWHCLCRCGVTSDVLAGNLISGVSRGCPKCSKRLQVSYSVLDAETGKERSLTDVARERGIKYVTLRARLRRGWTMDEALAGKRKR